MLIFLMMLMVMMLMVVVMLTPTILDTDRTSMHNLGCVYGATVDGNVSGSC